MLLNIEADKTFSHSLLDKLHTQQQVWHILESDRMCF